MRQLSTGVAALAGSVFSLGAQALAPALDPQPYDVTVPVKETLDTPPIGIGAVKISFGGFIKLDALFSIFSDGRVPSTDSGRDNFKPLSIPVVPSSVEDPHSMLDFHARDSRFSFKADTEVAGHALGGLVEMDFRSANGGASEVVTNAYNPRIRRGFVTFDEWTLGQEWTTFRNADAVPEHIDDEAGPSEALNTVRQPLLRWAPSAGLLSGLQVSLENSETNLMPNVGAATSTTFVTGDSQFPDLVTRYGLKTGFGSYGVAAVARELKADQAATGGTAPFNVADGTAFGYGVNLSGKVPSLANGEVRFALNYGDGIGRYVGLASAPDAVVDAKGGLDTVKVAAGYISYHQPWNAFWRSNLTLGTLQISNDTALAGTGATKSVDSGHVNLLYTPVDKLLFGLEYLHAIRKLENGDDGTLDRVQFSTKYSF